MAKKKDVYIETPFYKYLWWFYSENKKIIKKEYKDLTKKILANAAPENSGSFLRSPQYEAFEIYVFLKEYLDNARLSDLFDDWSKDKGKFRLSDTDVAKVKDDLFASIDAKSFEPAINNLKKVQQEYTNYIFSLTMGTGKTILMALCIFYEFLLANKYPKDPRYCHNALVLAPDTTVLQSLKEIQTFDKSKIFSEEYANKLDTMVKFHFLAEDGIALSTADGSDFNLIISTSQKIILKKSHNTRSSSEQFFLDGWDSLLTNNPNADLYSLNDDEDLMRNQRYIKLTRLKQLGIYVDEAHHAFGKTLKNDMLDRSSKTSLRLTIDNLAAELKSANTAVVACYNFTGTPYIENHLMPEVVFDYGLKDAIENKYLKNVTVQDWSDNLKTSEYIENAINEFLKAHRLGDGSFKRYEGMLPKMAIFAATIEELTKDLQPAVEEVLKKNQISIDSILVNVGDEKKTKQDDLREFLLLDTTESKKQFILLVGKGKEGWNCRSLFAVALFRKPKSSIFVLQATMRCLRSITDQQQNGQVFLSTENLTILQNELEDNFRVSVEELTKGAKELKPERRIYVREKIPVKVLEQIPQFRIKEKRPCSFKIFDDDFDFDKYRRTVGEHNLKNINSQTIRREISSAGERQFTEYSLIAELSIFLTQHEVDENGKPIMKYSPVEIMELLQHSTDGIEQILSKVNYSNDILYDYVIPKLFSNLYEVKFKMGEPREVTKYIVKDPPLENSDESGKHYYKMRFDDEKWVEDTDLGYSEYSQKGNKKSFDLSGYGFDSQSEKKFFDINLFSNNEIKHIWFTGMLTNGQSDFFVRYIDPDSHALRSYYPDFLVEMKSGIFYIVEIKGENLISKAETKAKVEYARLMFQMKNKMNYVLVPSNYADMILQTFLKQSQTGLDGGTYQTEYLFDVIEDEKVSKSVDYAKVSAKTDWDVARFAAEDKQEYLAEKD